MMSVHGAAFSAADHAHMAEALRLAARGLCTTRPNPRVGCVIAQGDRVVGVGWHRRAGEAHAEALALAEAGERARGATAYVTLEPCAHVGRTPPCADALIAAGVARVVIAHGDPFAEVDGRGLAKLRAVGIRVDAGLMHADAREINRGFFSRIERARPWLRLKLAMSLDGRTALANGQSHWITGEPARRNVQHWRARSCALLTGVGTVLADDPQLTVRLPEPAIPAPLRVVLDTHLRTPSGCRVLDGSVPTLVVHGEGARTTDSRFDGVELAALELRDGRLDLCRVLALLAQREINEVQVEAGATLCGAFFAAGLVDEVLLHVAPVLLGNAARPLLELPTLTDMRERWNLELVDQRMLGNDWSLLMRPGSA